MKNLMIVGAVLFGAALFTSACGSDGGKTTTTTGDDTGTTGDDTGTGEDVDLCTEGPRLSPFVCMRFNADCSVDVQVETDGDWFGLVSIDGVTTETLKATSDAECGEGDWKKRLAEDVYGLLLLAGGDPGDTVDLELSQVADGTISTYDVKNVPATEDKRDLVKDCWEAMDTCPED